MFSGADIKVERISADIKNLAADLAEEHSVRLYSRGGHFSPREMLGVYFMLIYGCTEADGYTNFLYGLKEDIKKQVRPFALIDSPLDEPDSRAMAVFASIDRSSSGAVISGLCMNIEIRGGNIGRERTILCQRALGEMLSSINTDVFDIGVSLVTKLNMIANAIGAGQSEKIPILLYYGNPEAGDALFLCYAQRCGFDVICISPDKSVEKIFDMCPFAADIQKEEFPYSGDIIPYPSRPVKTKIATVAYNAERELDTMLYNGDTMFRDRQFKKMDSAVLKTTVDEIFILWEQAAKFRAGFNVRGDRVTVPTIFAKLSGADNGDIKSYWDMVEDLLTPDTLIHNKSAVPGKELSAAVTRAYAPFRDSDGMLMKDRLMHSSLNPYGYLPVEIQAHIFEKIEAMIRDGLFTTGNPLEEYDYAVFSGLTLNKRVLQLLQQYDFTKEVPKFIVVDAVETMFSKLECAQLLLMSYLGFDVLILSPCGYRDIEVFVSDRAFEIHTFNDFVYNVKVPSFSIPSEARAKKKKGGFFGNLFNKKGR
ncbi:MAG: YceG family protein [Oscillospiraceae bacterium]|nr:YceG family protein [Oscillospiraceae bacterium]